MFEERQFDSMPDYAKDAVIAILGSSVALAGLLLVFSGFVFAQADGFPKATTDDAIINRYRKVGRMGLVPFLLSLSLAALSVVWFICPSGTLYASSVLGFLFLLLGTAVYAIVVLGFYL
jgi:hypothetical protein